MRKRNRHTNQPFNGDEFHVYEDHELLAGCFDWEHIFTVIGQEILPQQVLIGSERSICRKQIRVSQTLAQAKDMHVQS